MRITDLVMIIVAAADLPARTFTAEARQLNVCIEIVTGNLALENAAKGIVFRLFASIGVKTAWLDPRNCPMEAIYISFSVNTRADLHPAAIAYALPYEGTQIIVFLDRVKEIAPNTAGRLLGYTLTHEITHIVEGIARHSENGIMKARWDPADHDLMRRGRLGFAPEDIRLIFLGLNRRELRGPTMAREARIQRLGEAEEALAKASEPQPR